MSVNDGDVLKAVMEVNLEDGTIAQNVYHFHAELAAPQTDVYTTNLIEEWIEALYSEGSSYFPSTMTQRVCWIDKIAWDSVEEEWYKVALIGYFTPTIGFNDANEPLPNMSSAFATFTTSRPKSRGRRFFFPWGEDAQDATYLSGAALTALTNMADEALDSISYGPFNTLYPCIVRVAANVILDYLAAIVTNVLGTQRRRRPTVGI